ncbi:hypothetical protein LIER_32356 [Lithospermum erythrorhizon]|uniref:Uncharacterized protein n=1 Tax=Lithospermum erythrorhizon TaxID=34254 RepID=A0AAV3RTL9_LITER
MNLVNAWSFNPAGMMASRMSGKKGASPANSVLVPRRACLATLAERAFTCLRKAAIASERGAGATASRVVASDDSAVL